MDEIDSFWYRTAKNLLVHQAIDASRVTNQTKADTQLSALSLDGSMQRSALGHFKEVVALYTQSFLPFINHIVDEMDQKAFYLYSSVDSKYHHLEKISTRFELLRKIDLETHTLNVVYQTMIFSRELPDTIKAINVILALLHDFGKCKLIKESIGHTREGHWKTSAEYAKRSMLLFSIPSNIQEKIYQVLYYHHDVLGGDDSRTHRDEVLKKLQESDWYIHLCRADTAARENELNSLTERIVYVS